jgi:hypothetical protein
MEHAHTHTHTHTHTCTHTHTHTHTHLTVRWSTSAAQNTSSRPGRAPRGVLSSWLTLWRAERGEEPSSDRVRTRYMYV